MSDFNNDPSYNPFPKDSEEPAGSAEGSQTNQPSQSPNPGPSQPPQDFQEAQGGDAGAEGVPPQQHTPSQEQSRWESWMQSDGPAGGPSAPGTDRDGRRNDYEDGRQSYSPYGQGGWNAGQNRPDGQRDYRTSYGGGERYNPGSPSGYRNPYGAPPQSGGKSGGRGWQDPSALNTAEPYKWNFEEYDNAKSRQKMGSRKAGKVALAMVGAVAGIGILCLAGVGAWYMLGEGITEQPENYAVSKPLSEPEVPNNTDTNSPGLTLTDRPKDSSSSASEGEPLSTPDIADKVKPSVVGILNYGTASSIQAIMTPSEGSGIIMSEDGYILTNAHVVEKASGLKVVLENGDEYEASIVGADDDTDIAVIKINAKNLPYAEFGNSDQLRVGEKVVAIGNPRGLTLAGSVTQGIVSAVNRSLSSSPEDFTYIQTDAAINPGNSGGALVNEYGQVIGINTAKISQVATTVYEGIGFAIPITEAKPIIDDLKAYGRVTGRVKFGITVQTVDAYTASMYQIPQGAMIISTEPEADITKKGIMAGDIIYAIDGVTITSSTELKNAVYGKKPGDTVMLSVYRRTTGYSDKKFDVSVMLMEDTGENSASDSSSSSQPQP